MNADSQPRTNKTDDRPPRPAKGAVLELTITDLAYGGEGIARHEGFVLFVKWAVPGDRVRVRVRKAKKSHGEAQLLELIEPAPERVTPECPLFTICGGCSWQQLPIEEQLRWKLRMIHDALRPLHDSENIVVRPIVPSPHTWRYRNKMEFTFSRGGSDGKLRAGFHRPGNWREILDVERCWLAPETMEGLLRAAVAEGDRQGTTAWDPTRHTGTLRQFVIRHSVHEDAFIGLLLTGDRKFDFEAFADRLMKEFPAMKGIAWGLNSGKSDVARAEEVLATRGELEFEERLGPYRFQVSLTSFFQTNTTGAEKLYEVARDYLELSGTERLLDAYCGTGSIGIFCSDQVSELYGVELVQEAIWDARENARRNGVGNATFLAGEMRSTLPKLLDAVPGRIDRLVVDPPRSGMDKKSLAQLVDLRAPVVVYVSCNPTTMARDLLVAQEAGYRIEEVTPVDLFPHTYHVECVTRLVINRD